MQRSNRLALPVLAGAVLAITVGAYALGVAGRDTTDAGGSDDATLEYVDDSGDASASKSYAPSSGSSGSSSGSDADTTGGSGGQSSDATGSEAADEQGSESVSGAAADTSGPSISVASQRCSGGLLIVTTTARDSDGYRKGVQRVGLERQNDENAWFGSTARWLGDETGNGDQWTGELTGNQQGYGKTLRITATDDAGNRSTITAAVTAAC